MWAVLVGIGVTWLASVLTHANTLLRDRHKRSIAVVLATLATGSAVYAGWSAYRESQRKDVYRPKDIDRDLELGEASGGSTAGDTAYVVNDETTGVFVSQFEPSEGYFKNFKLLALERCADASVGGCRRLVKKDVNDLEGVAVDPRPQHRELYLVTSHSNNRNGKQKHQREALLRLDRSTETDDAIRVSGTVNLRPALEKLLFGKVGDHIVQSGYAKEFAYKRPDDDTSQIDEIKVGMEIEGLAMDANGMLYFGLRAPLCTNGHGAIIVTATADELFANEPFDQQADAERFKHYCVGAEFEGTAHGIVSMEYDTDSREIVVLTGSPYPYEIAAPRVCRWSLAEPLQLRACTKLPPLREPQLGKQEALLLPPASQRVITMLDTEKGLGGQISYTRSEAGLP
jgi:hypothetical protein